MYAREFALTQFTQFTQFTHTMKRILTEHIDCKRLKFLLDHESELDRGGFIPAKFEFTKLQLIRDNMDIDGNLVVEYTKEDTRYKANVKGKHIGLTNLSRTFRGFLSDGSYYDVDMVGAQPTILNTLAPHSVLTEYLTNRDEFLEKLGIAKQPFLTVLFNHFEWVRYPLKPLQALSDFLRQNVIPPLKTEFPELWEKVLKKRVKNKEGKFLAHVLQKIECSILDECIEFSKERVSVDVLIHDGFMLRASEDLDLELFVTELQAHIRQVEIHGRRFKDLSFSVKAHNDEIEVYFKNNS